MSFLKRLALITLLALSPTIASAQAGLGGVLSRGGPGLGRQTLPGTPNTPSPADNATNIGIAAALTCAANSTTTFDIKIETTSPPVTSYSLGGTCSFTPQDHFAVSNLTAYYWQICASNAFGTTCGPIWHYTTVASAPPPGCSDTTPSPTGRTPLILWTPCTQTFLNQAYADYLANPTAPTTLGGNFMKQQTNMGRASGGYDAASAAVLYQASGDSAWAQVSYDIGYTYLHAHVGFCDDNQWREILMRFSIIYDWIYPGLTPTQRTNFLTDIMADFNDMTGCNWYLSGGLRVEDTDQTIGFYFGTWALHTITGGVNPTVEAVWDRDVVGGLDPTATLTSINGPATSTQTIRNVIKYLVEREAIGGQWMESSEYNPNTTKILMLGYQAMKNTLGTDHFPELALWWPEYTKVQIYQTVPTKTSIYEFGDDETPRSFRVAQEHTFPMMGALAIIQGTDMAPYGQDYLVSLVEQYGYGYPLISASSIFNYAIGDPYTLMMGYNPNQTRGDYTTLPACMESTGQGFTFCHNGWGPNDSFFGAEVNNAHSFVDHQPGFFNDFQLYRHGDWSLTHQINLTYGGGVSTLGHGVNSMSFYDGLWSYSGVYHKLLAHEASSSYAYQSGTSADSLSGGYGSGDVSPIFLNEATASQFYLPSSDKHSDTVIQYYRFNQKDPLTQCNIYLPTHCYTFYLGADLRTVIGAGTNPQSIGIRVPIRTAPSCVGAVCSWTTTAGETALQTTLLPAAYTRVVQKEGKDVPLVFALSASIVYPGSYGTYSTLGTCIDLSEHDDHGLSNCGGEEHKYMIHIKQTTPVDYTTYLSCAQVHDGITTGCTLVESADHNTQGALVARTGLSDEIVLFNGRKGMLLKQPENIAGAYRTPPSNTTYLDCQRLARVGYTVPFTSGTASTNLHLVDLDPAGTWTYTLDGGSSTPLSVSSQGVANETISGSGAHTLVTSVSSPSTCTGGLGLESLGQNSLARVGTPQFGECAYPCISNTKIVSYTTSGSNRLLVVSVRADLSNDYLNNCTYAGITMTKFPGVLGSGDRWAYALILKNPALGTNNVVCTFNTTPDYIGVIVSSYTGADQTTQASDAEVTVNNNFGNGATLDQVAIPLRTNSWMVLAGGTGGTGTAGAGSSLVKADAGGTFLFDSNAPITTSGNMYKMVINGVTGIGGVMFPIYPLVP